jgi:predicted ATPase
MITSVEFKNFRSLRDTVLPLQRCTLIVGPNGSGKSTALKGLTLLKNHRSLKYDEVVSVNAGGETVSIVAEISLNQGNMVTFPGHWRVAWEFPGIQTQPKQNTHKIPSIAQDSPYEKKEVEGVYLFSLNPKVIAASGKLSNRPSLSEEGAGLVVVLDQLRDKNPERFAALNVALSEWFKEFDQILFDTLDDGSRTFLLRTAKWKKAIPAAALSDGTLSALTLLTLAYLANPPKVICLEEPERSIHPRLLKDVQEALYRLSYPENFGEDREPVQVIATTHSPYLLDLFRDYPEQVVLANKTDDGVSFEQLSAQPNIEEILRDSQLGEVWYTGILGGVPAYA